MAFDHDASSNADEHDDPDHRRLRPPDPPPDEPDGHHATSSGESDRGEERPPRKRWATERDEPVTAMGRARNLANVDISVAVAPDGDADVDSHISSVGTRLGMSKFKAGLYCDVGIMFRRMPKVLAFARSGALTHEHLLRIAAAIIAVSDDHINEVENKILDYLRPTKEFQALPGVRTFAKELRRIVDAVEPISTPPDEDEKASLEAEQVAIDNEHPGDFGEMNVFLRKDRMAEFDAVLRSIRDAKIKSGEDCTLADALMAMSRGDFTGARATINIYADATAKEDDLQLWMDGAGWLPKYLTKQWLERCEDVRLSSDSRVDGYVPSDAQKARVRARDGGCRFPGCDVPAHKCQTDHVVNYDPEAVHATSSAGFTAGDGSNQLGVTATWNLQCLCQNHHNLKTSRHWNAVMNDDASVDWFDHTGTAFASTVPHGPIAHIKRQTFDQRATRLAKTIRGANAQRLEAEAEARAAMEQMDLDAALRKHADATAEYEREIGEFIAGPLNSTDPEVAAEASALMVAADDGWPCVDDELWSRQTMAPRVRRRRAQAAGCHRARIDADPSVVPVPPAPLGPDPTIPF